MDKFRATRRLARFVNPLVKLAAGRVPGTALLETIGRRSGLPRTNPVGYHLEGNTMWIVAEHGPRADYVKNLKANPNVRIRLRRRWMKGVATPMPEEDPKPHLQKQWNKLSTATVRGFGTEPMVVRIDLSPQGGSSSGATSSGSTR